MKRWDVTAHLARPAVRRVDSQRDSSRWSLERGCLGRSSTSQRCFYAMRCDAMRDVTHSLRHVTSSVVHQDLRSARLGAESARLVASTRHVHVGRQSQSRYGPESAHDHAHTRADTAESKSTHSHTFPSTATQRLVRSLCSPSSSDETIRPPLVFRPACFTTASSLTDDGPRLPVCQRYVPATPA
jgi:hypothetical protein